MRCRSTNTQPDPSSCNPNKRQPASCSYGRIPFIVIGSSLLRLCLSIQPSWDVFLEVLTFRTRYSCPTSQGIIRAACQTVFEGFIAHILRRARSLSNRVLRAQPRRWKYLAESPPGFSLASTKVPCSRFVKPKPGCGVAISFVSRLTRLRAMSFVSLNLDCCIAITAQLDQDHGVLMHRV